MAQGAKVTLDGSGSSDPDGHTLSYAWTQTGGTTVTLENPTTAGPSFAAPTLAIGDAAKTLTFKLVVTDELGLASTADTVTITVTPPANQAPTAVAGSPQTVGSGASVTLDGSGSTDPDAGQTLSYAWTAPSGVTLSDATTASPSFTAPAIGVGGASEDLTFSLIVTDDLGLMSTADTVTITVTANQAPTALAGSPRTVASGANVTLDGNASTDPDGHALSYAWTAPRGVTLSDATAASPSFTAPTLAIGDADQTLSFSLMVTDTQGASSTADTVTITVDAPANQAPTAVAGSPQTVGSGASVTLDGSGSTDPDAGQTLSYAWTAPSGVTLSDATAASPTFTAPAIGMGGASEDLTFSLIVTDDLGLVSTADTVTITVTANQAPTALAGGDQTVVSGASVTLDGAGSTDPDAGQTLSYAWTAPRDVTLSDATAASPSFTAPAIGVGGASEDLTFSLIVTDDLGLVSTADTVTITVTANQAPTALAGGDQTVVSGASVTLDGAGSTDPDAGQTLSYAWTAPRDVTLSDATAASPTFTAPTLAVGDAAQTLSFSLVVTDTQGASSTADTVTITVDAPTNQAPTAVAGLSVSSGGKLTVLSEQPMTVASGANVTLNGSGSTDPDGQALSYAWTQTGGPTVTLSDATIVSPSFTAPTLAVGDATQTLTFSLVVTDEMGLASAADTLTVMVVSGPTVTLSGGPTAIINTDPFTVTASFSKPVSGFDQLASDVSVSNATVTAITGGPVTYTLSIVPTGGGDVSITVPVGAAQDMVGNANGASNTLVIGNQIATVTQEQIASFALGRANSLSANQPDVPDGSDEGTPGSFALFATQGHGSLNGFMVRGGAWAQISSTWSDQGSYTLGAIGAHTSAKQGLTLGWMVQLDYSDDRANNTTGQGWMVGPYFVAKAPTQPLTFEGRLLYGQTNNKITPLGTYTDSFKTERWLAKLRVKGQHKFAILTLIPLLDVNYTTDSQKPYKDSLGSTIPGQTVSLTQMAAGLDFSMPLSAPKGTLNLTGGLSVIHSSIDGATAAPSFSKWRGRTHLGLNYDMGTGAILNVGVSYDGLGTAYETYGAKLSFDWKF